MYALSSESDDVSIEEITFAAGTTVFWLLHLEWRGSATMNDTVYTENKTTF